MKRLITLAIFVISLGLWVYQGDFLPKEEIALPEAKDYQDFVSQEVTEAEIEEDEDFVTSTEESIEEEEEVLELVENEPEEKVLGTKIQNTSINLDVPFTSQAPTANWEQPWQDACEEASLMMVDYYYKNKAIPSKETTEQILFDMAAWQEENWNGHHDLSVADLARYIELHYDYSFDILDNLTIDKIKESLDKGLPVIVPANGKILDNPHFSNGGPVYHMLVIKGYLDDKQKFITNDPGTRHGEDFLYSYDNMMTSIADWDKESHSTTGPKRAIILYKN